MGKRNYKGNKRKSAVRSHSDRLANQLSISVILSVTAILCVNINIPEIQEIREKVASAIGRNALGEFIPDSSAEENINKVIQCINLENDDKSEEEITEKPEDWINPVDDGILSSPCGKRINPILNKEEYHNGIDIAVEEDSEVYAVRSGTVCDIHFSETYGNVISFKTEDGYTITYNHLNSILVQNGDRISQGDVIAKSGATGLVTGPHLHYSVWLNDMLMDPIQFTTY